VRVLQLRSKIALGQAKDVSAELASEKTPDLLAVKLLADQEQGKDVSSQAKKLAEQYGQENLNVQLLGGIALEKAGETEEALALLSKHQGSLDAYVQRHFRAQLRALPSKGLGSITDNATAWPSSFKSIYNRTAQTWRLKRPSAPENGHKTVYLST
jgi:coatomer protein complex subunit epsilon